MWDLHDSGDPGLGPWTLEPQGTLCRPPWIPPPDRLRVRGESVEAGPAGWKEPGLGVADGQTNLQACRPPTEHVYPLNSLKLKA